MAEADDIRFILLGNAHLDFPDILNYLCADLGLRGDEPDAEPQDRLLRDALAACAGRGQAVALLIDDAHHLRIGTLRSLWDFAATSAVAVDQRLQVVLAGLPEIEGKLRQPELRPLRESLQVQCRLGRLSALETELFIAHQLKAAGHAGADLLSPAVVERIAHYGQGVPCAIAKLCDTVLLFASLQAEREITPAMVDEAAQSCFFGDQAQLPKPADLEPPIASAAIAPSLAAEALLRWSSSGTLVKRWVLVALTTAAIIWLWPSEPVPKDQPPPHYSLVRSPVPGQREYLADPPGASPPVSVRSPVPPEAAPPAIPAPEATESGTPASENRLVLPTETAATPRIPDPVSITQPQAGPETKPNATGSRADQTSARPLSQTTRPQASRVQSQPRVAKYRKATKHRKVAKARYRWASTVRYPWEKPTATGFNQK
jgi:type II secretory pathway predicted ATPase ExeA